MTTAEIESLKILKNNCLRNVACIWLCTISYMKLESICLVSSLILELAKLMQEQ